MQEGQWEVALENGDIKRMTVDQLDDAFRLGIVRGSTMVREVGDPEWLPLEVAAGLTDEEQPNATADEAVAAPDPAPVVAAAAGLSRQSLPVPRPRMPSAPPTPAYSSRVPPPVAVSRPSVAAPNGNNKKPMIPVASVTRSEAPQPVKVASITRSDTPGAPPPLPEGAFKQPPVPEVAAPAPATPSGGPPPLPPGAFNAPDPNRTAQDLAPIGSEAQAAAVPSAAPPAAAAPPLPAQVPANIQPSPASGLPVSPSLQPDASELAFGGTQGQKGGPWGIVVLAVATLAGLLVILHRQAGVKALDGVFGQPSINTPRGVERFIAQVKSQTSEDKETPKTEP